MIISGRKQSQFRKALHPWNRHLQCSYIQGISQHKVGESLLNVYYAFRLDSRYVGDGWRAHLAAGLNSAQIHPSVSSIQSQWRHSILLKKVRQAANLKLSASCQVECQNKSLEQELLICVCGCENWAVSHFLQVRMMAKRKEGSTMC